MAKQHIAFSAKGDKVVKPREVNKNGYHYTGCGLEDVWLVNGYEIEETPYGEGVMIYNLEGLHKAIAKDLVRQTLLLTGPEFRFLRKEMNISQGVLGKFLGVTEQTVANYEKGKGIPKSTDVVLRSLYLEYINKNSPVTRMAKEIVALDNHKAASAFQCKKKRWSGAPDEIAA